MSLLYPFLIFKALCSFSDVDCSLHLLIISLNTITRLWSLHCLSVVTQRLHRNVISGFDCVLVHVQWVLVCSWKKVCSTCFFTPFLHLSFTQTSSQNNKNSTGRLASVLWEYSEVTCGAELGIEWECTFIMSTTLCFAIKLCWWSQWCLLNKQF